MTRLEVYSDLCGFQEVTGGREGRQRRAPVFVKLWEWNYVDVARECKEYLGPNGLACKLEEPSSSVPAADESATGKASGDILQTPRSAPPPMLGRPLPSMASSSSSQSHRQTRFSQHPDTLTLPAPRQTL